MLKKKAFCCVLLEISPHEAEADAATVRPSTVGLAFVKYMCEDLSDSVVESIL